MGWFFQSLLSALFLLSIVLSIPIAFDVGGRDSGLAYSLALFFYYFIYSAVRAATAKSTRAGKAVATAFRISQWVVIPSLLIWALGRFAVDAGSTNWVERTFEHLAAKKTTSWSEWTGNVIETITLGGWDKTLRYSSPVFQLLEGFCTLLVIQASGQITRRLVNSGRSDTWMVSCPGPVEVFSQCGIASTFREVLMLIRTFTGCPASRLGDHHCERRLLPVAHHPVPSHWQHRCHADRGHHDHSRLPVRPRHHEQKGQPSRVLSGESIQLCLTCACAGLHPNVRLLANLVSFQLFAYVVLCVYQIFTDFSSSADSSPTEQQPTAQPEFMPLPPIILASYSTIVHMLGSLPNVVHNTLTLLYAAFQTTTPSVIISLTYRIFVFYSATRLIPAIREYGAQALMEESGLEDSDGANKLLEILSWFSPSVLIAIYTSLLLQHFSVSDGPDGWTLRGGDAGGNGWRWANIVGTMGLYAIELYLGQDETNHWKVD